MQRTDGDSVEKLEANTEESLVKYYGRDRVALPGERPARPRILWGESPHAVSYPISDG